MLRHQLLNSDNGHFVRDWLVRHPAKRLLRQTLCQRNTTQRSHRQETDQCTLEFANVVFRVTSQHQSNIIRQVDVMHLGLPLDDYNLGLEVRWLNISDESPLKTRMETFLNLW